MAQGRGMVASSKRSNLTLGTELTTAILEYQQTTQRRLNVSEICRRAIWEVLLEEGLQGQVVKLQQQIEDLQERISLLEDQARTSEIRIFQMGQQEKLLKNRLSRIADLAEIGEDTAEKP